ncbi:hypothetical protein BSKO_09071 [Bryopsis sp. KO-2023]|nr:hypothetical protein BSKO_09071 [Bryopsis sp. KO-2023]
MGDGEFQLRWGIVGTGQIATAFVRDLRRHGTGRSIIAAVLSRSRARAEVFGCDCGVPSDKCFVDFDQFLASGVDVCYIASPHTAHVEQALRCLSGGVSVLVEKPLALSKSDAERVFRVARENGLFAMEALWTRFLPAMEAVCACIQSGEIGTLMSIDTDFGFDGANGPPRLTDPALGGGSLFDVASYALHLPTLFLPEDKKALAPKILHTESKNQANGVDDSFRALLCYSSEVENLMLSFRTSIVENTSQTAVIRGSQGVCVIEAPFGGPDSFHIDGKRDSVAKTGHGLHYQVREVERCMQSGMLESSRVPWKESISWAGVLENLGSLR